MTLDAGHWSFGLIGIFQNVQRNEGQHCSKAKTKWLVIRRVFQRSHAWMSMLCCPKGHILVIKMGWRWELRGLWKACVVDAKMTDSCCKSLLPWLQNCFAFFGLFLHPQFVIYYLPSHFLTSWLRLWVTLSNVSFECITSSRARSPALRNTRMRCVIPPRLLC